MKNIVNGKARRRIRGRLFALTLATSASMSGYAFAQAPVAPAPVRPPAPEYEPLPIYGPQLPPGGLPTPPVETQDDPAPHID